MEVAGRHFAQHGYEGTNVRSVAAEADVSPNLVTRYFGGKAGLFAAASDVDLRVRAVLPGPFEDLGARIARKVITRWEDAGAGDPLMMMVRSAGSSPDVAAALGDYFARQAMTPLVRHLVATLGCTPDAAADRVTGVGALIMGVVMSRYVVGSGPLADADAGALERWLADRLQRLLTDPAPPPLR